jgi:hypothetical protein
VLLKMADLPTLTEIVMAAIADSDDDDTGSLLRDNG